MDSGSTLHFGRNDHDLMIGQMKRFDIKNAHIPAVEPESTMTLVSEMKFQTLPANQIENGQEATTFKPEQKKEAAPFETASFLD